MNRLSFSQMVAKNLNSSQNLKFFSANQILGEEFHKRERFEAKLKYAQEHINLTDKVNGLVAHIYTQLMEKQSSPYRPRLQQSNIAKKNIGENAKDLKFIQPQVKHQQKPTTTSKPNKTKQISAIDTDSNNLSIPRLKVIRSCKQQQRRNSETQSLNTDSNNFENHKRMKKVLAHQLELENMLAHHKQLKEHRQSIAQDIFAMRHCLDDVRHRLNNSLKMLENKKTYTECHRSAKALKCDKCTEIAENDTISKV